MDIDDDIDQHQRNEVGVDQDERLGSLDDPGSDMDDRHEDQHSDNEENDGDNDEEEDDGDNDEEENDGDNDEEENDEAGDGDESETDQLGFSEL